MNVYIKILGIKLKKIALNLNCYIYNVFKEDKILCSENVIIIFLLNTQNMFKLNILSSEKCYGFKFANLVIRTFIISLNAQDPITNPRINFLKRSNANYCLGGVF